MLKKLLISSALIVSCVACSNDDNPDDGLTRVYEISPKPGSLEVGDLSDLTVRFSYNTANVFIGQDVYVVVQLPQSLRYFRNSIEVIGPVGTDTRIIPDILECNRGINGTFISVRIDNRQLVTNDAENQTGTAELKLRVEGALPSNSALVGARADILPIIVNCNSLFVPNEQARIEILSFDQANDD